MIGKAEAIIDVLPVIYGIYFLITFGKNPKKLRKESVTETAVEEPVFSQITLR